MRTPRSKITACLRFGLTALLLVCAASLASAQPSGGPYGPVQLDYALPEVEGTIYFVAPEGHPDSEGTSLERPTSLSAAIAKVTTGDAIVLRGGVYRTGDLTLNQGITMQPYRDERPVLKGTRVAKDWEALRDGLWRIKWDTLFPMKPAEWWRREREAARTPLYLFNNDMLFVDGELYPMVGWPGEIDGKGFYVDYEEGYVYIGTDPTGRQVEITAFDNALTLAARRVNDKEPDGIGPKARGITFTQYAYRAIEIEGYDPQEVSPESAHGMDIVDSVFENCTISYCSRVGGYFRGNGLVIRNCLISHTSTEGIFVLNSHDVLLERNIVTHNNMEGITGYFNSAIKIFNQCYRVVCRENLIIDNPGSSGIWYDVGNVDGLIVNNWVQNTYNGFFFEISKGAICAGNVFVNCDKGIWALNSERVRAYQNTLINSRATFERTERSAVGDHFGWHPATGPEVEERHGHVFMGNLIYGDEDFEGPLLNFEQREVLRDRLKDPQIEALDYNVYVKAGYGEAAPFVHWSPSQIEDNVMPLAGPEDLNDLFPRFESHSLAFPGYNGPLFHGEELSRFSLVPAFPAARFEVELPREAYEALGWKPENVNFPGAFPTDKH